MAQFDVPASAGDPDAILAALGGFWSTVYVDNGTVRSLMAARAALQADNLRALQELSNSYSRFKVPVYRRPFWRPLQLPRSAADVLPDKFGSAGTFGGGGTYGQGPGKRYRWPLPADWRDVPVLTNRTANAGVVLVHGIDYTVEDGIITFAEDPFLRDDIAVVTTPDNEEIMTLWAYRPGVDADDMYRHFGYAVGVRLPSGNSTRDALNAIFDALVEGSTRRALTAFVAAAVDAPITKRADERVEKILEVSGALWVVTDQDAYKCSSYATAAVAVGDVLPEGTPLCDAFDISDFRHGTVPAGLKAVAIGKGFLDGDLFGTAIFLNENAEWTVGVEQSRTTMTFPVRGTPGLHDEFWRIVHERGVAAGQTLAGLYDARPTKTGEPTAAALPKTVNPLEFLCGNILRNNVGLLRLRPRSFGVDATPQAMGLLRKIVPPATALLISVELQIDDDPVMLANATGGTETEAGYTEDVEPFIGQSLADGLDDSDIAETVTARALGGGCV